MKWQAFGINVLKLVFGLALLTYCLLQIHTEMERATPSNLRIGIFAIGGLLGILTTPTIGAAFFAAGKNAITLGSLGRRAYDGKLVTEAETPAPTDGAP